MGGNIDDDTDSVVETVKVGDVILDYAPTPIKTGKTLEGWTYDEAGLEAVGAEDVASVDVTLYALWKDEL